jgi:hypothetical protein
VGYRSNRKIEKMARHEKKWRIPSLRIWRASTIRERSLAIIKVAIEEANGRLSSHASKIGKWNTSGSKKSGCTP